MIERKGTWEELLRGPNSRRLLDRSMKHVARGLSGLVGEAVGFDTPQIKKLSTAQKTISTRACEKEVVGVYLLMEGGLRGQAVLILPLVFALNLANSMMNVPRHTAKRLGPEERSALAEVGNLALSYFLNSVATLGDEPEMLQPSPPAVIVDLLSNILNLVVKPVVADSDRLQVIETVFRNTDRSVQFRLWILPNHVVYT